MDIKVSPNISKLLARWSLGRALDAMGVQPEAAVLMRYGDGATRAGIRRRSTRDTGLTITADLHRMLFDLAVASPNVSFKLGTRVTAIDPKAPSVTICNGDVLSADLIVCADSVHSLA